VTEKTFPPVIFGTRQLFLERFHTLTDPLAEFRRKKVWKDQWTKGAMAGFLHEATAPKRAILSCVSAKAPSIG
jgi:hypothetical protein